MSEAIRTRLGVELDLVLEVTRALKAAAVALVRTEPLRPVDHQHLVLQENLREEPRGDELRADRKPNLFLHEPTATTSFSTGDQAKEWCRGRPCISDQMPKTK